MKSLKNALALLFILIFSGCSLQEGTQPQFSKIFIVILENTAGVDAAHQPFIASLSSRGAVLENYYGITYPSQPNYIALVAGDTLGVTTNDNVTLDASHLGDLLRAKGRSWTLYAEDYPGNCFLGATSGQYARKHVPFLSFANVQNNPAECANVKNAAALDTDIQNGSLSDVSIYVPNLNNDGHDTGIAFADQWLKTAFESRLQDPKFISDMLFVVTFDEDDRTENNKIHTVLYGPSVVSGSRASDRLDHYSLLRLIEDVFSLGNLGRNDVEAKAISGVWRPSGR